MRPSEGLADIISQSDEVITDEAKTLFADLKLISPVGDTGDFKRSWAIRVQNRSPLSIRISNSVEYADVLARGRRKLPNFYGTIQWYGSHQWPNGLSPMLAKTNKNIEKAMEGIRA